MKQTLPHHRSAARLGSAVALALLAATSLATTTLAEQPAGAEAPEDEEAPGYIVVFNKEVNSKAAARDLESEHGLPVGRVYEHAIKGAFVPADLPPQALAALERNPNVSYVEKNAVGRLAAQPIPTGLDRVDGEEAVAIDGTNDLIDVDIAVIDTGIDPTHPDLNVNHAMSVGYHSAWEGKGRKQQLVVVESFDVSDWADWNGHGTHVAGTAAAMDNEIGVVGVAPGARVTAVRVLHENNASNTATYLAGMDYVAAHADVFEVANMSIGHSASAAINDGVANMTAAGVVVVAAAGNEARDVDGWISPGSAPSAITVSALADSDGLPGGLGPDTSEGRAGGRWEGQTLGADDTLAVFSNYGSLIDVAAPGVDIYSCDLNGSYSTKSGTSMSSPHVAGAVALYLAQHGRDRDGNGVIDGNDVALMEELVRNTGWQLGDYEYFAGDPDTYPEPLLNVPNLLGHAIDKFPLVSITSPADGATVSGIVSLQAEASDDFAVSQVEFFVGGASVGIDNDSSDGYGLQWDSTVVGDEAYEITAVATDDGQQSSTASVMISVDNVDSLPVADAGTDQTVEDSDRSGSEWVTLDGSGSSDDRGIADYAWYEGGTLIATGASSVVEVPVGVHTLTLVVTDSMGQTAQDTVVITVENGPPAGSQVVVESILLIPYGGKNGNNHLQAVAYLKDDLGVVVEGAAVEADLYWGSALMASSTSTTDASGAAVLFDEKSIGSFCFSVVITNVTAAGLTFDGTTPSNQYCK